MTITYRSLAHVTRCVGYCCTNWVTSGDGECKELCDCCEAEQAEKIRKESEEECPWVNAT